METTIEIPAGMQVATTAEVVRLRTKQVQAKVSLRFNPYAWAMNVQWRVYFRQEQRSRS